VCGAFSKSPLKYAGPNADTYIRKMPEKLRKRAIAVVRHRSDEVIRRSSATELERRERQLASLYELSRIAPEVPTERLLKMLAERATVAMEAHTCSILLRERGTDRLHITASVGLPADVSDSVTLLIGERIAGRVAETRQPILVNNDPQSHPMLATDGEIKKRPEVESALCAPLLSVTGEALGVLCLSRHRPAMAFNDSDLKIVSLFASQAGGVIAERQKIEDLLTSAREQAKMERELERQAGLAAMGQFAAMIAHEMRNPLGAIKGAAQFVLSTASDDTVRDFLAIVVEEVNGLAYLTTDLLDFARPAPPTRISHDLREIARNEVSFIKTELAKLGVSDVRESYPELPAITQIDAAQIGRALRNLLLNAAQALAAISNTMIAARISVSIQRSERFWLLQVEDNGPGLPDSVQTHLWEPFFTTKARGTGLGLAQVKRTLEAHDGGVDASNSETGGARFTLRLPIFDSDSELGREDKN
jgi:two-component system, NtrC family, sensor histidine kinase HydH